LQIEINYINPKEIRYIEPIISKGYKGKYDIYYTNIKTGKRSKKTTKTAIQREANKELDKFKRIYYNNIEDQKIKYISDLLRVINEYKKCRLSKKTLELYNISFKKLISVVGNKELRFIMYMDVEKLISRIVEKISKSSINIYIRTLKAGFNYAKKLGAIYENPVNAVDLFKIPNKPRLCFENEDIPKLIDCLDRPFLIRIVKFALESSARIGEILNIQWCDVDFEKGLINISNKGDFQTKTGEERFIPISKKIMQLIKEKPYLDDNEISVQQNIFEQNSNIYELNNKENKTYVFGKIDGTKFSTTYISKLFKKKIIKAGFEDKFHFHCTRHTSITGMGNSNFPLFFMQKLAGHKNIKTTEGYVHVSLNEMRNWMNSVNYSGIEKNK